MCNTYKDTRRPGAIDRLQGETWPEFLERLRAIRKPVIRKPKKRVLKARIDRFIFEGVGI
jgi:hypothetical protein